MRLTADFAPIWEIVEPKGTTTPGTGGAALRKGKKRSRSKQSEEEAEQEERQSSPRPRVRSRSRSRVDVKDQYYVAGYDPDQPLPSAFFPHSPIPSKRGVPSQFESEDAFASLNPPLQVTPPSQQAEQSSLQRQHVSVMNQILHISLLRGDYHRAGQAFSLLLRAAPSKTNINLRTNGNWGVGAEILLRQGKNNPRQTPDHRTFAHDDNDSFSLPSSPPQADVEESNTPFISSDGIAAAKAYYEALILQHPFDKLNPHSTDARTFYPALFSLLIYDASEGAKAALARLPPPSAPSSDSESDQSDQDNERQAATTDIKRAELSSAKAIAKQIDDVLVSPPYDRFVPLLRLRGMVALWEADLCQAVAKGEGHHEGSNLADDMTTSAKNTARDAFRRVISHGGTLPNKYLRHAE
ncbi:hypothetical protein C1H76_9131 [Elsinoe australis]|uniref:Uncharacterized protein n=1 Tax=Elsinoe australis TaxID=40998 RepID=A0A4U7AK65_9PEZI|nr:hypothetical protein C1H76_9131 [Elsinoe australis]